MTIIQMDTEIVNNLAERLQSTMSILDRHMDSILKIGQTLDWEGLSRDEFLAVLYEQNKNHLSTKEKYENLVFMLKQEISQWEQAGNKFGDRYFSNLTENNLSGAVMFGLFSNLHNPSVWNKNIWLNLFSSVQGKAVLEGTFKYFKDSRRAQDLLADSMAANIHFQLLDENGKIIDEFGAENGTLIPVQWVSADSMPGALGGYNGGPPPSIQLSDEMKNATQFDLRGTLAHEMQHAIDYESGTVDRMIINEPYGQVDNILRNIPDESLDTYNLNQLEDQFSSSCMERLKTEVNAHARGFALDPKNEFGENIVNMDGNFTPSELKHVLIDRNYANYVYKKDIIKTFHENGYDVNVSIVWDEQNNKVAVKISDLYKLISAPEVYNA
jgi:hypothetical protein